MSYLGETFNAADMPQGNGSFDPLPQGVYTATITKADLKDTKDGTGKMIALRLDITGPSHQGRVIFSNLNIRNKSPQAEEIGRQQLGDIMRAIGLSSIQDTDQMIGGQVQIKVDIEKKEGFEARNQIRAYKSVIGSAPPAPVNAPAPNPAATGGAAPPWAKR